MNVELILQRLEKIAALQNEQKNAALEHCMVGITVYRRMHTTVVNDKLVSNDNPKEALQRSIAVRAASPMI